MDQKSREQRMNNFRLEDSMIRFGLKRLRDKWNDSIVDGSIDMFRLNGEVRELLNAINHGLRLDQLETRHREGEAFIYIVTNTGVYRTKEPTMERLSVRRTAFSNNELVKEDE